MTLRRSRDGAAALEFALVAVACCFLLTLSVELFWQFAAAAELDYGVREATRFAITGAASSTAPGSPTCRSATIVWLVTYVTPLNPKQLSVSSGTYSGGTLTPGTTGGSAGQTITYTFTYRQYFFTSIASALYGQAYIDHRSTTVIKNEPYSATTC